MAAFRDISVKYKITAITLLTAFVVLVLASVVFVGARWLSDRQAIGQELETIADIIGNNSTAAIAFDDRQGAREILSALRANPNIEWAFVYRANGTILAEYISDRLKAGSTALEYNEQRRRGPQAGRTPSSGLAYTNEFVEIYRPIRLDGKTVGAVFIRSDLARAYAAIATYIQIAGGVILIACVLAVFLISRLHKVISLPIMHLLETIRMVSANQDFSVRAEKHGADELGVLIDGFNMMLARTETHDRSLREAQERAETANRAKDGFLAKMSHELRTPLNAIIGFSEIIKDDRLAPSDTATYREYAGNIHESGCHLLDLINDILDLSKIKSGVAELQEEIVGIRALVRSVQNIVKGLAETSGVELELDMSKDISAVRADHRRLKQILINLLANAIKFTPEGGKVTLRVRFGAESGAIFQIIDTGIGIALADIPKALAPFQQIDGDLSRAYEGTGLGLPLSKALAEMHGGVLDMQSEVGVGTTITVRLPAHRIVKSSDRTRVSDVEEREVSGSPLGRESA
jgi:signal transduction histidine kinase